MASNFKDKLALLDLDELPSLPFPNDCFPLFWLDVLVLAPLAYACSILAYPGQKIVLAIVSITCVGKN